MARFLSTRIVSVAASVKASLAAGRVLGGRCPHRRAARFRDPAQRWDGEDPHRIVG
jgi:hypothetical protein